MGLDFHCCMPARIIIGAGSPNELADTPHLPGEQALIVIQASGAMRKQTFYRFMKMLMDKKES